MITTFLIYRKCYKSIELLNISKAFSKKIKEEELSSQSINDVSSMEIEEEKEIATSSVSSRNNGIKELKRSDYTYAEFESSEGISKGKIKVPKEKKKRENKLQMLWKIIKDFSFLELKKKIENSFVEVVITCIIYILVASFYTNKLIFTSKKSWFNI